MDEEARLKSYVQQIGQRIVFAAKDYYAQMPNKPADSSEWMFTKSIQFHLMNNRTLNGATAGGEHVYIYVGLFMRCDTEDELAAVVAHEYCARIRPPHPAELHAARGRFAAPGDHAPADHQPIYAAGRAGGGSACVRVSCTGRLGPRQV